MVSDMSQYKSHGNRLMVFCGVICLAAYRGLRDERMSQHYATLLVGDIIWKLNLFGEKLLWLSVGLMVRKRQKKLNATLHILCKYPFNLDPKGYQFKFHTEMDHLSMGFTQSAVHQLKKVKEPTRK